MQNGAYSFFLIAEVKPGSDGTKIRRSEKFFTNKYVFKKIKLFFWNFKAWWTIIWIFDLITTELADLNVV